VRDELAEMAEKEDEADTNVDAMPGDDKAKAPPQSKPRNLTTDVTRHRADADVDALAAGLDGVSLAPDPGVKSRTTSDAPEAIKRVAALLSSDKYTNIVVLTGAGISCNAGIPGKT
jgi:hypothetical protein